MKLTIRQILHWAGSGLAILGISFVALRLYEYSGQLDFSRLNTATWFHLAGLTLLYAFANIFLALAWRHLLSQFNVYVSRHWAVKTYGISQLAKYIPGNIFHFAGRQAMGLAAGLKGWSLAKSTLWELGLISIAGALFSVLLAPLILPHFILPYPSISSAGFFVLMIALTTSLFGRYFGKQVAYAFVCYSLFLIVSGLLFADLFFQINDKLEISSASWLTICGAYVLAWLIGLMTPGAPAGVGVRELVLLFLLKGTVTEADLFVIVLLGRIITVSGDLIFYVMALMINTTLHTQKNK